MEHMVEIKIRLDTATQQVNVFWPQSHSDKIFLYGLLDTARDIIRDTINKAASPIIVPRLMIPGDGNGSHK